MSSRVEFGKLILQEEKNNKDEWKTVETLETGIKLGNFVWKQPRNFFRKLFWGKFKYVTTDESVKDFLQKRENHTFSFETEKERKTVSSSVSDEKRSFNAGSDGVVGVGATEETMMNAPARDLTITWIKRSSLEEEFREWNLNMESGYIKEKKSQRAIPCIINKIVEADMPNDHTDGSCSTVKKRRLEGNIKSDSLIGPGTDAFGSLPVKPEGKVLNETKKESKSCIVGPILYKVLPLEVTQFGNIMAKEESRGFIEVVLHYSLDFFGEKELSLQSNIREIEEFLRPLIDNKAVAAAFKAITDDDISQLCHLFEQIEDSTEDVDLPDTMSQNTQDILQFANFQQESGRLKLKKKFKSDPSFNSCYYLTVLLAEIPPTIRSLIERSTVSLYSLLKTILLQTNDRKIVISDDVLKCPEAKELLEKLHIVVTGSSIERKPKSLEKVADAAWISLLYNSPPNTTQQ
ncbi:uncharacterized protein LOC132543721 [Ylistrum balloti]|uniref:uncharacterized protein LOC132543721 n=1 Tax=Ylistrum balloti TaxID=509963 RepID=UPI002905DC43|nr:uncharacterized protein LOC132543721 [Ylistrum balloti]XP_060063224.1 uncharacterized protein LOC132543721 [Ylistrum balloti]XP_060063225.1 uncharacterized protein LOC132543721 [Ylistrum balloti]